MDVEKILIEKQTGITPTGQKYCFTMFLFFYGDELAGEAMFAECVDYIWCQRVYVEEKFRRCGIATKMYDEAAKHFNKPVRKSDVLSDLGELFWTKYQNQKED